MIPEQEIREVLVDDTDLAAIVGQRVHVNAAPLEGRRPCVVIKRVSTSPVNQISGGHLLTRTWLQIGARSERIAQANEIMELVRQAIEAYQGGAVQTVKWLNRVTAWDPTLDTHAVDDDYAVWTAAL